MKQIDVADLDCIYLSYDEPQREEFWVKIRNMVPWAQRVDGVKGSDAAHKAAAHASSTDRFILIDGDNLPDPSFFNQTLVFPNEEYESAVFRWRARNHINGLMYGNGGLSSWTKDFVQNMRTHEATDGTAETQVEFCFDPLYWPMHDCYSNTYPNGSAFHAWRAGFREGVKMCLQRGRKPTVEEFKNQDKDIRILTYRVLLEKFNDKYADLNENQKNTLKEFINSIDSTSKLKEFYNTKINEIKSTLSTLNKKVTDKAIQIKINEVINILPSLTKNEKVNDDHLINLLQHYQLVEELETVK